MNYNSKKKYYENVFDVKCFLLAIRIGEFITESNNGVYNPDDPESIDDIVNVITSIKDNDIDDIVNDLEVGKKYKYMYATSLIKELIEIMDQFQERINEGR